MAAKGKQKASKMEEKEGYPIDRCKERQHRCDELGYCVVERQRKDNLDFLFVAMRRPVRYQVELPVGL